MKKLIAILLSITAMLNISACSNQPDTTKPDSSSDLSVVEPSGENQPAEETVQESSAEKNYVLIAYFSIPENVDTNGADAIASASVVVSDGEKLGNTEYVAKIIQKTVGGDLFRIETVQQYPLEHETLVDQADDEKRSNYRPELFAHVSDISKYDTIILGYPNWWADLPMPVYSFLEEYDFGAKTIIPFVTHGGSGFSSTLNTISELQPGAFVSPNALSISRNDVAISEEDIISWAESLGLNIDDPSPELSVDSAAFAAAAPSL